MQQLTVRYKMPAQQARRLQSLFRPTNKQLNAFGFYLVQQVQDRFQTQGASGGTPWPAKRMKSWGYDDGRSILTGKSARLKESFSFYTKIEGGKAFITLFSDAPYARVHQLGTRGKGGVLPTIKPKTAKALFIPITDRAISSERISGPQAAYVMGGQHQGPIRVATRYSGGLKTSRPLAIKYTRLVKGRLKDGKLQRWNEKREEWEDGVPDFIWLKSVSIAPRPMLPTSGMERAGQAMMVAEMLRPKIGVTANV